MDAAASELVQGPTLFYMVINSAAVVVALILIRTFGWNFRLAAEATPTELRCPQAEVRIYWCANGSERERGPSWYFRYHPGGSQRKLRRRKTEGPLVIKRR